MRTSHLRLRVSRLRLQDQRVLLGMTHLQPRAWELTSVLSQSSQPRAVPNSTVVAQDRPKTRLWYSQRENLYRWY